MIHAAIAAQITPAIRRRTGFWIIMIISTPEWTSLYSPADEGSETLAVACAGKAGGADVA